nr:transposase [Streptomyces marincola]
MEDPIGALGPVLHAPVLFHTRYMAAAVHRLRADGFDVRDEDVARLSPSVVCSTGNFLLTLAPGGLAVVTPAGA